MKAIRIIVAALALGAAFTATACNINKATGQTVCLYSGAEMGWQANLRFATIDGQPVLVLLSDADAGKISATEVSFRIEGQAPFRLPVYAGSSASNCFWGTVLVGACMPTTTVFVKLDRAIIDRLAGADRTYVAATDGASIGPAVKLKGKQMKKWASRLPAGAGQPVAMGNP